MNAPVKKTIHYGDHTLTLETGHIARQATAAVMVTLGQTVVLVTVVSKKEILDQSQGFFPLRVDYQGRSYAAGRIPGGYFRREGRPTEDEILSARLIDRALRPLFPEGFENEVQIVATVLSLDPEVNPDIPALIGASAAVTIAGIPFLGPVAAARVGYRDGIYLLNPTAKTLETSQLDLVAAGSEQAVVMVESEARELSERVMLGAVMFGHSQMQAVIEQIKAFAAEVGNPKWEWQPPARNKSLAQRVSESARAEVVTAYQTHDKLARHAALDVIRQKVVEALAKPAAADGTAVAETNNAANSNEWSEDAVKEAFNDLEKKIVRDNILAGNLRIDGRDTKTVRSITINTGVLPRTHGSVVFTRGETQAIVVATLGTGRDAQSIDALEGERKERFMLHYNFPPFSVGEVGQIGSPKRREIGHGRLAWRALQAVLPNEQEFPYVLRVVSEITESNGSSSMATVCGGSLALMDAGVPIKAPVAGIAMGLIKESDRYVVLTDILGDEDHLGDMDFKVAGTANGVTALQMDIKINGITQEIMEVALEQARQGRIHILGVMNGILPEPRTTISPYAPRIMTIKIDQDKIRDVIGKGGATIRAITEETGVAIDISDDGTVMIAAVDQSAGEQAMRRISDITTDLEVGGVYAGKVTRLADFGAFVMLPSGKEGLLHISQIAHERVEKVSDKVREGDQVTVKVLEIDRQNRIRLSVKALLENSNPNPHPNAANAAHVEETPSNSEKMPAE